MSLIPIGLLIAGAAAAQTAVEAGLGAGSAATSTAPASGIGKAISNLIGNPDKTKKDSSASSGGAATVTTVRMHSTPAKKPVTNFEDPSGIQSGLSYTELVQRFGPPAMEITGETGTSLSYAGKAGIFQLQVRDGKVVAVDKPRS